MGGPHYSLCACQRLGVGGVNHTLMHTHTNTHTSCFLAFSVLRQVVYKKEVRNEVGEALPESQICLSCVANTEVIMTAQADLGLRLGEAPWENEWLNCCIMVFVST